MSATARVARQLTVAGGILTALAVLAPPAVHFGLSYQHAAGSLEAEAEIDSLAVTRIIAASPELWTYEKARLSELLSARPSHHDSERRRVLDPEGRVVAENADPLAQPFLVRSLPLFDAGVPVGRIELSRSLRPLLLDALLLGLGLLPLALVAFVLLRSMPLRVIRDGERALRRQRDARQSYLDAAGVAFLRLDEGLRITLLNRQAEAVLGRTASETLGRDWLGTFVEPGSRERVAAQLATARPGQVLSLEHAVLRPDGGTRILDWFVTPLGDEAGGPGLLVSGVDLTRQRDLEQQLAQSQKLEAVGRLAGGVAHEFNNILSVIKVYGSALRRALPPESPYRADVDEIVAAADRAAAVARSLLTFSRRHALEAVPVDLAEVVRSAEHLLRPLLRTDIRLEVNLPETPLPVLADQVQIEQVLLNLVTNARDALGGPGHITVTASAERLGGEQARAAGLTAPGRYARLEVADDGPGFDAATRDRIFEPFFTTKEVGRGTGLGLSIAYGIVAQHLGAIACVSEPGHGATFVIRLPLLDTAVPAPAAGIPRAPPPGGRETILVAEDDASLRQVLRRVLERAGYTVLMAEDGLDAVARFQAGRDRIGLVLLDVMMPGQNGRQALDQIRRLAPRVPALFLSGHTADLADQRQVQLGSERFLRKPVEPEDLLLAVREQLDGVGR